MSAPTAELVALQRELAETKARADAAEAAWAKAKFRALPEIAQDAMDAVLARAHRAEATIHECEMRRDAAEARARAAEATIAALQTEIETLRQAYATSKENK